MVLAGCVLATSACGGAGAGAGDGATPAPASPLEALVQSLVQRGDGVAYSPEKRLYAYAISWQNTSGGEGRRVVFSTEEGREAQAIPIFEPSDPQDKPLGPALLAVRTALVGARFAPLDRIPWPEGAPLLDAGPFKLRLDPYRGGGGAAVGPDDLPRAPHAPRARGDPADRDRSERDRAADAARGRAPASPGDGRPERGVERVRPAPPALS